MTVSAYSMIELVFQREKHAGFSSYQGIIISASYLLRIFVRIDLLFPVFLDNEGDNMQCIITCTHGNIPSVV